MTHKITTIFHTSTHVNAPIHLIPEAAAVGDIAARDASSAPASCCRSRRSKWELIEPADLEKAKPDDRSRRHRADQHRLAPQILRQQGIFRPRAGPLQEGGRVAGEEEGQAGRRRHRMRRSSARDLARPAPQRPADQISAAGIQGRRPGARRSRISRNGTPAHKALLAAGIPTIENVGGDLDEVTGKRCTFQGFPWKWHEGDACVIRLVAMLDPNGTYRIEPGKTAKSRSPRIAGKPIIAPSRTDDSTVLRPQPPLGPRHAAMAVARQSQRPRASSSTPRTACLVQQFEGIMHRGTHMDAPIHVQENQPTHHRLSALALLRHRRRGVDPQGQMGRDHAEGSGERRAEDPARTTS